MCIRDRTIAVYIHPAKKSDTKIGSTIFSMIEKRPKTNANAKGIIVAILI